MFLAQTASPFVHRRQINCEYVTDQTDFNQTFEVSYILIIWLSNLSILSVPDEGYSRNALCALNLKSMFLLYLCSSHIKKN